MNDLILSGIQPSASQVHIGNYLGAMKRFVALQEKYPLILCIVDLHALTSVSRKEDIASNSFSLAAAYLALGLTSESTIIFRQSDIPEVCELAWYFACQFPLGLLERAHAFKDKKAKKEQVNAGLMFYPILMAADILLYKATKVPVGPDQKQHLEMAREIAEKFNHHFGTSFPVPEPLIDMEMGVVPGLDGRKMSKSYDNYIGLFESEKDITKKIKRIITDSKGVEDKKDPETCTIFRLYKLFASTAEVEDLRSQYLKGGLGYGAAKELLLKAVIGELSPLRERYEAYLSKPGEVREILAEGAKRGALIASETLLEVRESLGFFPKR
ncbi:MAG TPA: tryptophan--tRNA ligase [Oligoflexia bacterium]|nr:tryptophan--tRNA ligase [Oligoflexia bacterium]HMP48898.1 tryptophan--tRNA ligase [Oligoflexia bacterium]